MANCFVNLIVKNDIAKLENIRHFSSLPDLPTQVVVMSKFCRIF